MINLHERLSEFSYGYGVTKEYEKLLIADGLKPTLFLPSLVHEASLGFDVAFRKAGTAVLLQFKLGEEVGRFRRSSPSQSIPKLDHPFWRFRVDSKGAQFKSLATFEKAGAEVYYVAPRFSDWKAYEEAFQAGEVLARSLKVKPSEIKRGMKSVPGVHRVVYDDTRRYVCSEPEPIEELSTDDLRERIRARIAEGHSLEGAVGTLYESQGAASRLPEDRRRDILRRARSPVEGRAMIVCLGVRHG